MQQALSGKLVWITGAGSGIGRATAVELASQGAVLALSGRRQPALESVRDEIRRSDGFCEIFPLDVADKAAVQSTAARIKRQCGAVDVLVNCAGANIPRRALRDLTPEAWDGVVGVNLHGALYPILAVLDAMRERRDGLIVNVSSWVGRYPAPFTGAAYAASKRALIALSETLNAEENANGIRSCVICPAAVATEILDQRPTPPSDSERALMLQPTDVARLIRFVAEFPLHVCVNEIVMSPTRSPV